MCKISIVIPTFQAGALLKDALESIASQDFSDYELLIIDGGSLDNTKEIVEAFKAMPLKFIQEPDLGVYDAMNKGIKLAKGEWLYFMGADDMLFPNVFSDIIKYLQADVDIVYGNVQLSRDGSLYDGEFDLNKLLLVGNICHQAIFYHRSVFARIGNYNLRYKIWADWDFNIRCFKCPDLKVKYIPISIALYNNESGVSNQEDAVFKEELPVMYLREISFLKEEINALKLEMAYLNSKFPNLLIRKLKRVFRQLFHE